MKVPLYWHGLMTIFSSRKFNYDSIIDVLETMTCLNTLFFYKHMGKLGWTSIYLRFSQFEHEIMLDGMLNFKTYFMVWYFVWHEHWSGLFNIRNLVSSLILMFARICLCDNILYTWFGKKWKWLKKFRGCKIYLLHAYFFKHLSLSMLISFMLIKKKNVLREGIPQPTF